MAAVIFAAVPALGGVSGSHGPRVATGANLAHPVIAYAASSGSGTVTAIRTATNSALPPPVPAAPAARAALANPRPAGQPAIRRACPVARPGRAQCLALYTPQVAVNRAVAAGLAGAASTPKGLSPGQIQSAYKLPVSRDSHPLIAVSVADNTPHIARYLDTYRRHYHLPPCTRSSGCLRVVNQHGKASPLPRTSGEFTGWAVEATLDVSMISAACPHCRILLVEADDNTFANLAASEKAAAKLGARVISNSYGSPESGATQAYAAAYHQPGHTIVVASGDFGFTVASFPANLATVTAVGGTQLRRVSGGRGWAERVWNQPAIQGASGSGCSAYVAKPAWQHDPHCPGRTTADVSAVASGVPIYEQHYGGWLTVAGTSISAPIVAGIYGLAGNAGHQSPGDLYHRRGHLFDVTVGNNALSAPASTLCGGDYLCTAQPGYDAPTGLGTPDGIGAF